MKTRSKHACLGGLVLAVVLAGSSPASARFTPYDVDLGLTLAFGRSSAGSIFGLGLRGGVFVLPGVETGISSFYQTGSGAPDLAQLSGLLRLVLLPDRALTPFAMGTAGRLFTEGADAWIFSAGGGLIQLLSERLALEIALFRRWYLYPEETLTDWSGNGGLLVLF